MKIFNKICFFLLLFIAFTLCPIKLLAQNSTTFTTDDLDRAIKIYKQKVMSQHVTMAFPERNDIVSVETGYQYSMGLTFKGDLFVVGKYYNYNGETIVLKTPTKILSNVEKYGTNDVSYAITKNKDLYLWGLEGVKQPKKVMEDVVDIGVWSHTVGTTTAVALNSKGEVFVIDPFTPMKGKKYNGTIEEYGEEYNNMFMPREYSYVRKDNKLVYSGYDYENSKRKPDKILLNDAYTFILVDNFLDNRYICVMLNGDLMEEKNGVYVIVGKLDI